MQTQEINRIVQDLLQRGYEGTYWDYKEDYTDCKVQFTTPSGLHSVLERPFSEANGRPFLVKRSPLIVC